MSTLAHSWPEHAAAASRGAPQDGIRYTVTLPVGAQRTLARGWLWLAMMALIGSGLFSLLLVLSRTPGVNRWLPGVDFFRVALVVHVDLSVLVWFVALAGMLWSLNGSARALAWGWAALGLCAGGATLMAAAAFIGTGEPIMANYIPMLDRPLFHAGLVVFAVGSGVLVLRSMLCAPRLGTHFGGEGALRFGLNAAAVSAAVALMAFVWSFVTVPSSLSGKIYYEILYWGGGHALQFTWTLLMLVAWLWLASACGARLRLSPRVTLLMFALALVSVFVTPYAYLAYPVASVEHRNLLTWAMRLGGGVAIVPIALAVVMSLRAPVRGAATRHRLAGETRPADGGAVVDDTRALRAALVWSIVLFAAGGVIGVFINGSNVRIPAHYHGCIVGVTLALMGLAYHLMPQLGYGAPRGRLARWQPALYGAGQLMHIVGLVWSGGYGVQRKVAGADQVLRSAGEVAGMGLMGAGGLVAIVGGLLFVVVMIRAARGARV
jgi:cytochrome c oxidase subunit 1